jgi:hypothetical protein
MHEFIRRNAFTFIANLSLLILLGKPKDDEPLLSAWNRCRESGAWQACHEKYGGFDEYGQEDGTPFGALGAMYIAKYFRKYFLPDLPGANEKEKLDAIIQTAPPWLLWFTYGDRRARILGIKLPDLSKMSQFARGDFVWMDKLPNGPFEYHPSPDDADNSFMASNRKFGHQAMGVTPRERKRALKIFGSYE